MFDRGKLKTDAHKVAAWVAIHDHVAKLNDVIQKAQELRDRLKLEQGEIREAISFIAQGFEIRYLIGSRIYTVGKNNISSYEPVKVDLGVLAGRFDVADLSNVVDATSTLEEEAQTLRAMDLDIGK